MGETAGDLGAPDDEQPLRPRWRPQTTGGAFYVAVLVATLVALLVAGLSDWRAGVRVLAGVLGVAAALRLVLPESQAGMLAVRHRLLDVGILLGVAVALFLLAASIPDQPTA